MKRFLRVLVVLASIGTAVWLFLKQRGGGDGDEPAYDVAPVAPPVSAPPTAPPAADTVVEAPPPPAAKEAPAPSEGKSPAEVKAFAAAEAPYGPGSATAGPNGEAPDGFTIKGNAGSMLYHTQESPYYKRTKAEILFDSEESAAKAGFARWDAKKKK